MKWLDVPKFIAVTSCYRVNYGLTGYVKIIAEWEQDPYFRLQMIPDFQRGHVWTEAQQTAYMEYLFSGGQSGRDFYFNDPRWTKMKDPDSGYKEFVCVDGLQRTTAIQKFLNNEIKAFGSYYGEYDRTLYSTEQTINFHVNDLKTKEDVLTWYIQMNSGGTPHTQQEIDKVKALLALIMH